MHCLASFWGSILVLKLCILYCSSKMKQPHFSNTLFAIELSQCLSSQYQASLFSQIPSLALLLSHYLVRIAFSSLANNIQRLLLGLLIHNWLSRFAQLKLPSSISHTKLHLNCSISFWVMQLNRLLGINLPCNRFGALGRRAHRVFRVKTDYGAWEIPLWNFEILINASLTL